MKRSKTILLLFVAAGVLSGCKEETKPNGLRYRRDAQGQVMRDAQGNPLYEDDEGQNYTYSGGHFFPIFTMANGFRTIPGTGITAPASAGAMSSSDITSRRVPVSRGGFGGSGLTRSSGGGSYGG
ncbi:MAG TPA: hypothetical protein VD994_08305 [Prosthecobacter sp.]|nr:hypothetical protein [Prosthecobacter sp.]